jgi:hypothetical protein
MAFPTEVWRQRAQGGPGSANFIAREGGVDIGLAAIFAEPEAPWRMHLGQLYERIGFRATGERQPLPSNPARTESLLRLPVGGAPGQEEGSSRDGAGRDPGAPPGFRG